MSGIGTPISQSTAERIFHLHKRAMRKTAAEALGSEFVGRGADRLGEIVLVGPVAAALDRGMKNRAGSFRNKSSEWMKVSTARSHHLGGRLPLASSQLS